MKPISTRNTFISILIYDLDFSYNILHKSVYAHALDLMYCVSTILCVSVCVNVYLVA